jgi:hypothetical protein
MPCPRLAASLTINGRRRRITIFFHTKAFLSVPGSIGLERQDLKAS